MVAVGGIAVAIGWVVGRLFGSLGSTLSMPRKLKSIELDREEGGRVTLRMQGLESKMQVISMSWNADEVLEEEATAFVDKIKALKSQDS